MSTNSKSTATMVPVSGRLPEDLYQWLSTQPLEGAATVSDKLRVAVSTLKRLHEGDTEYVGSLEMQRDLSRTTRQQLIALEKETGVHSEVLAAFAEHVPFLAARFNSAALTSPDDAKRLEEALVRRALQLAEVLLRQALLSQEAAYDPQVVRKNSGRLAELLEILSTTTAKRGNHG